MNEPGRRINRDVKRVLEYILANADADEWAKALSQRPAWAEVVAKKKRQTSL